MSVHPFQASLAPSLCVCGQTKSGGPHLSPEPTHVVARRSDPETSWAAARSVRNVRESQQEVLRLFEARGPFTDEQAFAAYDGRQSVSGFRTRRAELVAMGLLRDSGHRVVGTTGRRMIVWAA